MRRVGVGAKSSAKKPALEEKLTKANKKLQEENAQLRAKIKELEAKSAQKEE